MRILGVTPYHPPEGGGLERYAQTILSRLASLGHDVHALSFTKGEPVEEEREGVHHECLRPLFRIGNAPVDPRFARHVRQVIRRIRPDIVVGHTPVPFPAEMAFLAARREGVPFVTTYHAGRLEAARPLHAPLAALDRWTFERRMLAQSARLIAVSPFVRDHTLKAHRDRVHIVPPGVEAGRFHPGPKHDEATILFVGPLDEGYRWKGVDVLWEAFQRVRRRFPEARLHLVGDGDRRQEFAAKAAATPNVEVLGRLSEDALVAAYQRATVLVLPSTSEAESFGMVLAEANACGRPVIGSAIGGIPSFIQDGVNGLLARPGDPEHLRRRIEALLADPERADALGNAGRERVILEHDWWRLAARTETVLSGALGRMHPVMTVQQGTSATPL